MRELWLSNTLQEIFGELNIDCVLDVGANKGQYRDFLRSNVEFKGTIISFEPIKYNVNLLRERSKNDEKWHIYPYALGQFTEKLPLNVMESNDLSSFSDPSHSFDWDHNAINTVDHVENVEMRRLDNMILELTNNHIIKNLFLKMDTQGHDLEVFKGGGDAIDNILALQSEISIIPIYKDIPNFLESLQMFTASGFELSGLFPVSKQGVRVIEFDCVMTKNFEGSADQ